MLTSCMFKYGILMCINIKPAFPVSAPPALPASGKQGPWLASEVRVPTLSGWSTPGGARPRGRQLSWRLKSPVTTALRRFSSS